LLISSLAGYSFARISFPGKGILFALLLFNLSVPTISTLIPLFKEIEYFGLFGTAYALILLYSSRVSLPTWILRNFFETVPHEIEESAMSDGCTRIGALFRVVLPFARSGLIAAAIIAFLTTWDDFLIAVIFANSPSIQTFPVIITDFATEQTTLTGLMFAAAIVSFIVPMVIAFALQKYLVGGLTAGSLKG
jgi:ABC-type glycerol-3-phosphate transport system permease component